MNLLCGFPILLYFKKDSPFYKNWQACVIWSFENELDLYTCILSYSFSTSTMIIWGVTLGVRFELVLHDAVIDGGQLLGVSFRGMVLVHFYEIFLGHPSLL